MIPDSGGVGKKLKENLLQSEQDNLNQAKLSLWKHLAQTIVQWTEHKGSENNTDILPLQQSVNR